MPIAWRSSLSAELPPALAVALSARALVAAAQRAGARVIALDLFGDEDTAAAADECFTVARRSSPLPLWERERLLAFDREALLEAVEQRRGRASGLVYGAGFEQDPALLAALESFAVILGNRAEVVAAVKDPLGFAALLARLGAPHPETALEAPSGGEWLTKRVGASGGGHVKPAGADAAAPGFYFQRRLAGRPVSALFLGDGRNAWVLGHSEQWADPTAAMPFRYGGCVGPVMLDGKIAAGIDAICQELVAALGLVGLNSLDLLLDGERFHVLELNPRPGATLDLFDGRDGISLWSAHIASVAGRGAPLRKMTGAPRAAAVVYAPVRLRIPPRFAWPDGTADRGRAGTIIESGEPVATVMATAPTPAEARATVEKRARQLLERLEPLPVLAWRKEASHA
jgi:predicted ATP-grasp superfamily ATP-dependent carboligase